MGKARSKEICLGEMTQRSAEIYTVEKMSGNSRALVCSRLWQKSYRSRPRGNECKHIRAAIDIFMLFPFTYCIGYYSTMLELCIQTI